MKKILVLCVVCVLSAGSAWSDDLLGVTRIGGNFTTEFMHMMSFKEGVDSFVDGASVIPGFEIEILNRNLGFNFRTGVMFRAGNSPVPGMQRTWAVDARPEFGLRLHIFGWDSFLDPFVEANVGAGVVVDITGYDKADEEYRQPMQLGWFAGLGAGLNVVLGNIYAGASLRSNLISQPMPATQFAAYDIGRYALSIHVGFNLENWYERTLFGYRKKG